MTRERGHWIYTKCDVQSLAVYWLDKLFSVRITGAKIVDDVDLIMSLASIKSQRRNTSAGLAEDSTEMECNQTSTGVYMHHRIVVRECIVMG